ncbi:MAG: PQQ-binding-like beta-propeller repeat protein [Bryobacteraceae bacterium]
MHRAAMLLLAATVFAEDWPEWRGKGRRGEWTESGIVDRFASPALTPEWRAPLRTGFGGPSVAAGRIFVTDFQSVKVLQGIERALALDERSGKVLWTREWNVDYKGLATTYATGPRASPTVDGDRVYVLGAKGALVCLRAQNGEEVWRRDFVKDFATEVPVWGMVGAPLVDGPRLIVVAGGRPDAKVVAVDKMTGKELWRALSGEASEPGYAAPVIIDAGGRRQLIVWHAGGVASLDPESGKLHWEQAFPMRVGLNVATPVFSGSSLLVSAFYNGPMMFSLDSAKPAATIAWRGTSDSETQTDKLHALVSTPVIDGGYVYGIDSYGQFRCLNADTGARVWETLDVTREKARWSTGHIVRNGGRYFINNDRGDLIIAELSPEGYREISRATLIKPTSNSGNRRELGAVSWTHPAYANRHIYMRNDEEIIAVSLGK